MKTDNPGEALLYVIKHDIPEISKEFLTIDLKEILSDSRKEIFSLLKIPLEIGTKIKHDGVVQASLDAGSELMKVLTFIKAFPVRFKDAVSVFLTDTREALDKCDTKKEQSVYILKVLSFFTTYLLGIVTDYSVARNGVQLLQLKKFKNVMVNRIVMMISARIVARFLYRVLNKGQEYLEEDHSDQKWFSFIRLNIGAIAMGSDISKLQEQQMELLDDASVRSDDPAFVIVNQFFQTLLDQEV